MRPLEPIVLVVILAVFSLKITFSQWRPAWAVVTAGGLLLLFCVHLLRGLPWTAIPTWLLGLFTVVFILGSIRAPLQLTWGWYVPGGLVGLVALAVIILLPVFRLPQPAGPYLVGVQTFNWRDPQRVEIFTPGEDNLREIAVRIYFPAEAVAGIRPAPFLKHAEQLGYRILNNAEMGLPLPPFLLSHLNIPTSYAYPDAPILRAAGPFPVVIFSHGLGASDFLYTVLCTDLASRGYVVAAINHPYSSSAVRYLNGKVVVYSGEVPGLSDESAPLEMDISPARAARLEQWVADQAFTLDQLERMASGEIESAFNGLLDLAHLGLAGHSFGGNASGNTCLRDLRFAACADLDGTWDNKAPLQQPMLFMEAKRDFNAVSDKDLAAEGVTRAGYEAFISRYLESYDQMYANWEEGVLYHAVVQGANHYDFTDINLLTPLSRVFGAPGGIGSGTLGAQRSAELVTTYTAAFFDRHLRGQPARLLDGASSDFPEITLERFPD